MPPLRSLLAGALLLVSEATFASQPVITPVFHTEAGLTTELVLSILPWLGIVLLLACCGLLLYRNRTLTLQQRNVVSNHVLLEGLLQHSKDAVAILSAEFKPDFINHALANMLQVPVSQLSDTLTLYLQQDSAQILNPEDVRQGWQGEAWLATPSGRIPLAVSITPQMEGSERMLLLGRDIREGKLQQQQTAAEILYDSDSGLFSALLLTEYLHTLIQISNHTHRSFAVMLVRINRLLSGNQAAFVTPLPKIFRQLAGKLSELANQGCILAKYQNDTLAILVPQHLCQKPCDSNLSRMGLKVLQLAEQCANATATTLQTTIGISIFSEDADSATDLMLSASAALVEAAKTGQSQLVFAKQRPGAAPDNPSTLVTDLKQAISRDEFELYFQPRISIGSNRVVGYEALLRWHNPQQGILLPQHFMSAATDAGLVAELDKLTFEKCCAQLQLWHATDMSRGRMSLNINTESLQQADFMPHIQQTLAESGLSDEQFEFELSETALLQDDKAIHDILQHLADSGIYLTLDNFGSGLSPLSILHHSALHGIKISPAYIKDMEHNEQQRNITASLIRLASYLQLDVIATGIENEMQAYLLHVMGCDILQGHLFSKAIPASEVPVLLARENRLLRKATG